MRLKGFVVISYKITIINYTNLIPIADICSHRLIYNRCSLQKIHSMVHFEIYVMKYLLIDGWQAMDFVFHMCDPGVGWLALCYATCDQQSVGKGVKITTITSFLMVNLLLLHALCTNSMIC